MDNLDQPIGKPHAEVIHYWAHLEAKSNTMAEELLRNAQQNKSVLPRNRRRRIVWGVILYLAFAIGFIWLWVRFSSPTTPDNSMPHLRHSVNAPKY